MLPSVTTWTDRQGMMLGKISQTETNTVRSQLSAEPKKTPKPHRYRDQTGGCQRQGVGCAKSVKVGEEKRVVNLATSL